jgi:hypothetical protein
MTRALIVAAIVALALAAGAPAARQEAKDTLQLKAVFTVSGLATPCPAGTPNTEQCFQFQGQGTVPGLGHVTEQYTATMSNEGSTSCQLLSFTPEDVLTVAGKGEIDLSIMVSAPCSGFPTGFTVTGGSGAYADASGSGSFTPNLVHNGAWVDPEPTNDDTYVDPDDIRSWVTDSLAGTLAIPNLTFDTAPPVISGAVSKTVRVPKHGTRVRVIFKVTARDAVDGSVPVVCTPRAGSSFKIGRTKVTCSASDSSANTASARFTITVTRANH